MKTQIARTALAAALLCGMAGAAVVISAPAAMASDKKETPSVSRDVGIQLMKAQKALGKDDYDTLAQAVAAADAVKDKTDYDNFAINQFKAAVEIHNKNYAGAASAYEAMIASPFFSSLEPANQQVTLKNGAALSYNAQHWANVVSDLEQLDKLGGMDAKLYAELATVYYLTKEYDKAGDAAKKSISLTPAGQKPEENALKVLLNAQKQDNDMDGLKKTQQQLALYYDWKDGWGQLIDRGLSVKGISELDALYLYRLRFLVDATSAGEDYSIAARMALDKGYATEAEAILEQGISRGLLARSKATQLSQAEHSAHIDRAQLPSIARSAANAKSGEQDIQLAEDYWGYSRYADAAAAARRGLAKGHLKDPGEGKLILAISLIQTGKTDEARKLLANVDGEPARAKVAELWDLYAQRQELRAQAAAQPAASQGSTAPAQQ